jgi:Cof subfamily protein (haloacid dehalogenase superfamily)
MEKVFITDLDGTLLNDDGQLSNESRNILTALIDNGVKFTVASARSIDSIREVIKDLPINMPIIEFNGSYISDYYSGEKLLVNHMNRSYNEKIYDIIESHNVSMIITTHENDSDYITFNTKNMKLGALHYIDYRKSHDNGRLINTENVKRVLDKDIICFNIIDKENIVKEIHDKLIETFGDELEVHMMRGTYSEEWYWLNVADPSGTKAHAIKTFKEMFLKDTDILYVFGDNNNDLGMFEIADVPVALENSILQLKQLSKVQIGYNYDNSVAKYIEKECGK